MIAARAQNATDTIHVNERDLQLVIDNVVIEDVYALST
jgi:hypothetical protein